eukprot:2217335-Pyramimonas_sp.AAC.1
MGFGCLVPCASLPEVISPPDSPRSPLPENQVDRKIKYVRLGSARAAEIEAITDDICAQGALNTQGLQATIAYGLPVLEATGHPHAPERPPPLLAVKIGRQEALSGSPQVPRLCRPPNPTRGSPSFGTRDLATSMTYPLRLGPPAYAASSSSSITSIRWIRFGSAPGEHCPSDPTTSTSTQPSERVLRGRIRGNWAANESGEMPRCRGGAETSASETQITE